MKGLLGMVYGQFDRSNEARSAPGFAVRDESLDFLFFTLCFSPFPISEYQRGVVSKGLAEVLGFVFMGLQAKRIRDLV